MSDALFQVKLKCPVCGESFSTTRVRSSRCAVDRRDSDFCVYYKEHNPIFYEPVVCVRCGYAAMYSSFDEISKEDIRDLLVNIGAKWSPRDFGGERSIQEALDSYKLVLLCSQLRKGVTVGEFAALCMRLAWLNRIKGNREEEKRFLGYALEHYMSVYDTGIMPENMDEVTLIYLIGELNRRVGNGREAVEWFSRAVSHQMSKEKPLIVKMAREQWSLVRNGS